MGDFVKRPQTYSIERFDGTGEFADHMNEVDDFIVRETATAVSSTSGERPLEFWTVDDIGEGPQLLFNYIGYDRTVWPPEPYWTYDPIPLTTPIRVRPWAGLENSSLSKQANQGWLSEEEFNRLYAPYAEIYQEPE